MCGIAGFLDLADAMPRDELTSVGHRMAQAMALRGPDDEGVWTDREVGVVLAHRRLSILDVTEGGRQPMVSHNGRYVLIYNGETFNFASLRRQLEGLGVVFRGNSDTEVVLEACAAWGIEATLPRLNGQFALALWDRRRRSVVLARDRMGIKPLYWSLDNGLFVFGSTLSALEAHPRFEAELDRNALAAYLRLAYVPTPFSIWRGARKLRPGHALRLDANGACEESPFWTLAEAIAQPPLNADPGQAVEALDAELRNAVRDQMVSDVPLGAFLSGGYDSTAVVAVMQSLADRPVQTFTIGFEDAAHDESVHAEAVAKHLGCAHTTLRLDDRTVLESIHRMPEIYDEPFADASQLPTYLVCRLARQAVTVALTGDGGDEMFGGYVRHAWVPVIWRRQAMLPLVARRAMASALRAVPPAQWDALFTLPGLRGRMRLPSVKMAKLAKVLSVDTADAIFRQLLSHTSDPAQLLPGTQEARGLFWDDGLSAMLPDLGPRLLARDQLTYLPDNNLTKVDRASMAVSLECRVPLLDNRIIDFAWRLPHDYRVRGGETKWILRRVLDRYVPRALMERPKMGFAPPVGEWLRGPLRAWAGDLLSADRLRRQGLFAPEPVDRLWQEHQRGSHNHKGILWNVLMFQAWYAARGG